ncbi:MAG: hypothetical protein V4615_17190 [Bacteroidota bacterium]
MKRLLLFIQLSIISYQSSASGDNFTAGARATAIGDASVTLSDVFSTTTNQAGLGFMTQYSVGIYSDRKFLNASINNFNGAIALPISEKIGTFGVNANYYGYNYYNETKIGLAYARKFGQKFSLGMQFDYLRMMIFENGSRNFYTFEIGMQYKPWKVLTIGTHIYNPIPFKVEKVFGERLPTILKLGLGYEPSAKVLIAAEYEQDIHYKPQFKGGLEYRPIKYLSIRAGAQTTPFSANFGLGVNVKGLNIDLASSYHPVLGFTPQAALIYSFTKKQKK